MSSSLYLNSLIIIALLLTACNNSSKQQNRIDQPCVAASVGSYPEQATSAYVLPWNIGEEYLVGQGNCTTGSHNAKNNAQFGYDFAMPIGTTIVAARAGVVFQLEASFVDGNGANGGSNYLIIEHSDGSFAIYGHLTSMGVLVDLAEEVEQGQAIALSGSTGTSDPHLHFEVSNVTDTDNIVSVSARVTLPLTFKNTREHPDGLVENQHYRAL